ncbi:24550_t:CDS:1, partial [Gigaspora rosea]
RKEGISGRLKRTKRRCIRSIKKIGQMKSKVTIKEPDKDIVQKWKKDGRAIWDIVWKNMVEELEKWITKR